MAINSTAADLILRSRTVLLLDTAYYSRFINTTLVISIIRTLQTRQEFKDFAFFISPEIDGHTNIGLDFFMPFARAFRGLSYIIIRRMSDRPYISLAEILNDTSMIMILTTGVSDAIMQLAALSVTRARMLRTMFLLYPIKEYMQYGNTPEFRAAFAALIDELNAWIWHNQFTNIIIVTIRNNVYLQNPYPTLQVLNKTLSWCAADFFVDRTKDLQGFVMKTPVFYDMPRVFPISNFRGSYNISGTSGRLFTTFLEHINATMKDVTMVENPSIQLFYYLDLIRKQEFDLLIHSFTAMVPIKTGQSYPLAINDWCIMMPYRSDNPEQLYIVNIFTLGMWLMIVWCALQMSILIWRSKATQPPDYAQALLQTIASICGISYVALLIRPTFRSRYYYMLLFMLGFFLSNTYISKLSSHLTTTTKQQQIDSVQDAIAAKPKIMVMQFEYDRLERTHPKEFLKLLIIVEKNDLDELRDGLNTSYAYSVTTDRWLYYARQQQYTKKKLFHLSSICMGPFQQIFPMQYDSHLMKRFNDYIMNVFQHGFVRYWEEQSFLDALHMDYVKILLNEEGAFPLSLLFYRYALSVWVIGLIIASSVFVYELQRNSSWETKRLLRRYLKKRLNRANKRGTT